MKLKSFIIIIFFSGICLGQSTMTLKDSLENELNYISNASVIINDQMLLDMPFSAPSFMICDSFDSLSFHHIQILPKPSNSLKPIAEALFAYDRANNGLNNWDIHEFVFLRIISKDFTKFKSVRIGQGINHIKKQLKDLIVRQIDNQNDSELILSTKEFNIVLWHNQSIIQMIRIQRKCFDN